ncbi:MAG: nuclear transport factor 2 family protein [Woeseiaceae bacterium]
MNRNMLAISVVILGILSHPAALAQDNEGVNGIYERMSAAYGSLDSEAFADIYAADAMYLSSDDNPMLDNVEAITANFERYFAFVRAEGGRLELLFRVVKRDCTETLCSDVGWYRNTQYDSNGNAENISYGRFLTTPGKSADGLWRFVADVDTGASAEHWNNASKMPGLHFAE